ncbi:MULTISPECIES: hypothetical protein [Bacillus subtilis group]|uniref:hypothetical protein n=1 Tax=Bacillus subtilis group TaxID=653685 RepID=UPI00227F70C7|nr:MULTISPECIES: hypothetical protein [Bacillus subtilis group]MCY8467188.1 hypothetical protein [Bacillus atrophaeus]MCY8475372.1 hypothetical protein [Bacillus halotolerans]MCY8479740.1 hypothetical protein [Bacillus atrophaeus]MCY8507966.1 hypothetical protein [Bacillus atrophaeus]MCY8915048.1 hypothetical protein [Bacillus atrophaeus]
MTENNLNAIRRDLMDIITRKLILISDTEILKLAAHVSEIEETRDIEEIGFNADVLSSSTSDTIIEVIDETEEINILKDKLGETEAEFKQRMYDEIRDNLAKDE